MKQKFTSAYEPPPSAEFIELMKELKGSTSQPSMPPPFIFSNENVANLLNTPRNQNERENRIRYMIGQMMKVQKEEGECDEFLGYKKMKFIPSALLN